MPYGARPGYAEASSPLAVLEVAQTEEPAGGEVTVLGPWTGPDLDSFWAVVEPFCERHGIRVTFESTPDVPSVLAARIAAGIPPDVSVLPGSGVVSDLARRGHLLPLDGALGSALVKGRYPEGWLDTASLAGRLYGLPYRVANESIIWYNPEQFRRRRWTVPLTWKEMVTLSEQIAASGLSPWALALDGNAEPGEAGTDWIENILLRSSGAEVYDRWVRHAIPWTDEAVRDAFRRWAEIVGRAKNLSGGVPRALQMDQEEAIGLLYAGLPEAYLYLQGSTVVPRVVRRSFWQGAGRECDFFPMPPLRDDGETAVVADVEALALLRATQQSVALMRYLVSHEAEAAWVRRGGFIPAQCGTELREYADPLSRRAARQLAEAPVLRLDASHQMPPPVAEAFREGVRRFVENPARLDAILASVERVAQQAYGPQGEGNEGPGG